MKNGNLLTLFIIVFLDLMGIGIMIPVLAPMMLDPTSALVPLEWTAADRNIALGFLVAMFPLAQFLEPLFWELFPTATAARNSFQFH